MNSDMKHIVNALTHCVVFFATVEEPTADADICIEMLEAIASMLQQCTQETRDELAKHWVELASSNSLSPNVAGQLLTLRDDLGI